MALWAKVAKDRPQHYCDVQEVDYRRTMLFHDALEEVAKGPCDPNDLSSLRFQEEARKQVATMGLVLAGGLMTEERDYRHKRVQMDAEVGGGLLTQCSAY
ncbi:unnamed protein product [Symbiodinium sp. CCMP2592]|nr:unnamed protein product [Symbiodinium sp. CCMP2592]